MAACGCPHKFANSREIDFGATPPGTDPMTALMTRQQGAMMEQFLTSNPFARQQLEMALGGRILRDGITDGKIRVRQFGQGAFPGGGISNTAATNAIGALNGINQAALASPVPLQQGTPNMYPNAILGGLANVLAGKGGLGGLGGVGYAPAFPGSVMPDLMGLQGLNPAGIIAGQGVAPQGIGTLPGIDNPILNQAIMAPPMMGGGFPFVAPQPVGFPAGPAPLPIAPGGGLIPGGGIPPQIPNFPALPGVGGGGFNVGGDLLGVNLNDPSLSVEDKVTLLLMQIMKKTDKEIEQQANNLQRLQAQGGQGANGQQGTPSIDVESMKLKRLIDKRNQMFDTLRQIVDKYNQTAKGIIDTVSR
jgi:hypothetical protein